jgi:DNA-binding NtrC family response regulator
MKNNRNAAECAKETSKTQTKRSSLPIVIIDDDRRILSTCKNVISRSEARDVITCNDSREAMRLLRANGAEMVLLDLSMPHVTGQELLPQIVQEFPDVPVVVMTGSEDAVRNAVACMKDGAYDFLLKPMSNELLTATVRKVLTFRQLRRGLMHLLDGTLANPEVFEEIVTRNQRMLTILRYVETVADSQCPLLVTGETGTGKELIAKAVHRLSGRPRDKYVVVNVAGLDDHMFSDTLFGHVRGAFTSADQVRPGMVETAGDGTLVLDEIGDLSASSQVKLLRLVQQQEYFALGDDKPRASRARVIAVSHVDLVKKRDAGKFRQDLYYRVCTHHIHLPPLRERLDDIPLLVEAFLEKAAKQFKKNKPAVPSELIDLLNGYSYPGNIRELESMVFDAVSTQNSHHILSLDSFNRYLDSQRVVGEAPLSGTGGQTSAVFGALQTLPTLAQARQLLIDEAMRRSNEKQTIAARLLGISQQALSQQIRSRDGAGE